MGLFRFLLGGESRKNLRKLDSLSERVLSYESKYAALSDEELRLQTQVLKDRLNKGETHDVCTRAELPK